MKIQLESFADKHKEKIWRDGFCEKSPEWAKFNGPYFEDYIHYETLESFEKSGIWKYLQQPNCRAILVDGVVVGMVSQNWIDEKTRWMEIGIVIYDENYWNKSIGTKALKLWTSEVFNDNPQIEHLGLTTFSGNPRMMKAAEKIGFIQEARIRKVRYWKGTYYDSMKYGVTREEWEKLSQE